MKNEYKYILFNVKNVLGSIKDKMNESKSLEMKEASQTSQCFYLLS